MLILWDFLLMKNILRPDPMMKLFAFGMLLLALSSTYFEGIQNGSRMLCSLWMVAILPLDLQTVLFAFTILLLALSSTHCEGIQTLSLLSYSPLMGDILPLDQGPLFAFGMLLLAQSSRNYKAQSIPGSYPLHSPLTALKSFPAALMDYFSYGIQVAVSS
jgi:hypothetical protein